MRRYNTIIIGSGAAGLAGAVRLHALGVSDIAIFTEGLGMGTSVNAGSDKQTYCKLGMYGGDADSPAQMARELSAGGSMHGDIALVESAMSPQAFFHLVNLGVAFPHDRLGGYVGYKTDHEPRRRATSSGPCMSQEMCRVLRADVRRRGIEVNERMLCVQILTADGGRRVCGALFLNMGTDEVEAVQAENVLFCTGGPGGLYAHSVYPESQTGGIGLALEAGAAACNLAESQFGLSSTKFRWNVSGSYMQVLPRFVSTEQDGSDEREFLRDYFASPEDMYNAIFLKGYQWPFAASNLPGSSCVDIFTWIEMHRRGRRVFLDYRGDPDDLVIERLGETQREYLRQSGALGDTPLERLKRLNAPAIQLYLDHGIDLEREPLEIAVCAQHNNGGLAGNVWWESVNLRHLFPIGEVNGTHGVTRPGGSALNSGQVGAFRAAEYIAARYQDSSLDAAEFRKIADAALRVIARRRESSATCDWAFEKRRLQERMSHAAGFLRERETVRQAICEAETQLELLNENGLSELTGDSLADAFRTQQLCTAQRFYLAAIERQIECIGSRGGSVVLSRTGTEVLPMLGDEWRIMPENGECRQKVMLCRKGEAGGVEVSFEECRPVPVSDGWFENVWRDFREKKLYL